MYVVCRLQSAPRMLRHIRFNIMWRPLWKFNRVLYFWSVVYYLYPILRCIYGHTNIFVMRDVLLSSSYPIAFPKFRRPLAYFYLLRLYVYAFLLQRLSISIEKIIDEPSMNTRTYRAYSFIYNLIYACITTHICPVYFTQKMLCV